MRVPACSLRVSARRACGLAGAAGRAHRSGEATMPLTAICKRLADLFQLEVDAIAAYEVAIEHAHGRDLQERLLEARNQHRRHAAELRAALEELGHICEPEHLDLEGL